MTPRLEPDEVHVWRAPLDAAGEVVERCRALLNDDEKKRADRFMFDEHRQRFTVGRGLLRVILGEYSQVDARQLRFCYNPYGKPALEDGQGDGRLRFNLSHSGGMALYAFALERELGVDIETIRPDFAGQAIAERFFSPAEVASLQAVDPEHRVQAFFACWTRKEAFIKARGKGMSIPLDSFEVSLVPDLPAALRATHDDPDEAGRWSLFEITTGPGFAGALAVEGSGCRIRFGDWPLESTPLEGSSPPPSVAERYIEPGLSRGSS